MFKKKNLTALLTIFMIFGTLLFPQTKANAAITTGWKKVVQPGTTMLREAKPQVGFQTIAIGTF